MKKIFAILLLILSISFVSCTKESASNDEQGQTDWSAVFAKCDDWKISLFIKDNVNVTNDYTALNFRYCPDNTVTVSNDLLAVPGSWHILLDKGNPNYLALDFDFSNPISTYWTDLENNWKIMSLKLNMIELQNDDSSKTLVFNRVLK